jgi:hypothetical protein
MVKGKEDAANDDVRCHYMVRTELINLMLDGINFLMPRWCAEINGSSRRI